MVPHPEGNQTSTGKRDEEPREHDDPDRLRDGHDSSIGKGQQRLYRQREGARLRAPSGESTELSR
jgi:hypothetical protein